MPGMLQATRDQRNMPFLKRGMRCNMDGKWGNITSGDITWLRVRFEDGSVVKDYKQAR